MRVPVYTGEKTLEFKEKNKPQITSGDVLIKVEVCGICGSDLHAYANGIMFPPGTVMGHEFSGVVTEVGESIRGWQQGDRVTVKPWAQCGECHWCRIGRYSLCPAAMETCIGARPNVDGAFAEYVRVENPALQLYELPLDVTFEQGALVEPLSTSLHAVHQSSFKLGDTVVVMGTGMIGMGVVQFLKLGGAGRIIAVEPSKKKAEKALEIGADIVLDPRIGGDALKEEAYSLTKGIGADIVFDCAGIPDTFQGSLSLCKSGGEIVVVGISEKAFLYNPVELIMKEIEMIGSLGYNNEFTEVIELLSRGMIKTDLFISEVIPLSDIIDKGFNRLTQPSDVIKLLVRPRQAIEPTI